MLNNVLNTVGYYSLHLKGVDGVDLYFSLLAVSEQDAIKWAGIKKPECIVVGVKELDGGTADVSPSAVDRLISVKNWLYTVTMFSDGGKSNVRDSRCIGLFADRSIAVRRLKENHGDLREQGIYNFAVIEPTGLGFYPDTNNEGTSWYKWSENSGAFEEIPTPEDMKGVCNLGIG